MPTQQYVLTVTLEDQVDEQAAKNLCMSMLQLKGVKNATVGSAADEGVSERVLDIAIEAVMRHLCTSVQKEERKRRRKAVDKS